jgi:hypothetical protein
MLPGASPRQQGCVGRPRPYRLELAALQVFLSKLAPMLLPRFTLRTLLAILTGAAVLSLFAGQAYGGRAWALGVTVAVASVLVALAVHAGFFWTAMFFGRWLGAKDVVARTSRGAVERTSSTPSAPASLQDGAPIAPTPTSP